MCVFAVRECAGGMSINAGLCVCECVCLCVRERGWCLGLVW